MSKKLSAERLTAISLTQAIEACRYHLAVEQEKGERSTPMFLGPPGQGKSAIVEQFTDSLNYERAARLEAAIKSGKTPEEAARIAGPEWVCISYRLGQCDPTDLKGVPVYINVGGAEMTSYAPPQIFPMVGIPESAGGKNVVMFLDELPQATQTMQNLAANIIDGKVGDYTIDMSRSFIVCAGNRKEDHAAAYDIPRNVGNRLTTYSVKTSFSEWQEWAVSKKLNPMVIGFLKNHTVSFNEPPPEEGYVYGTPRAWHKIANQIDVMGEAWFSEGSIGLFMAQGTVGVAAATQFHQFAKATRSAYSVADIMLGKQVKIPELSQKDVLFSLAVEITYRINDLIEKVVSSSDYQSIPASEVKNKAKKLTDLLKNMEVGPSTNAVDAIRNSYTWFANENIDPAFQVLLNKYQTPLTRDNLRIAMLTCPEFKETAIAFEKISTVLMKTK